MSYEVRSGAYRLIASEDCSRITIGVDSGEYGSAICLNRDQTRDLARKLASFAGEPAKSRPAAFHWLGAEAEALHG